MRPQKVQEIDIMAGLAKVFRAKGFDGASLTELAEATGLKKASLYHRFPGGKAEMAAAVLNHIGEWVQTHVFDTLTDKEQAPKQRLRASLEQISNLYNEGREVCIFRALSQQTGLELFSQQIALGMHQWVEAFTKVGVALGMSNKVASKHALQTLIEIQGSLILTKGMNDMNIFKTTLKQIEDRYLKS